MENGFSYLDITPAVFNPIDVYEVKILLAYFLCQIDRPVTPNQLLEIATGDGIVDYFLYAEATKQMLENGTLVLTEKEGTEYYLLSDAGRAGAHSFKRLVNKSVRDRIYAAGLRFFAKLKAEHDVKFEITPVDKGYSVKCVCTDGGVTLMEMSMFAPDKEQAEYIKSKILMNPTEFYSKVMDYVIENEEYIPSVSDD